MLEAIRRVWLGKLSDEQKEKIRHFRSHHFRGSQDLAYRLLIGSNLKALAAAYGTDKWTLHQYIDIYRFHFGPLRKRRLNILEIGIGGYEDPQGGGGSLRMWRTYFPKSRIFGIDIADKSPHDERRIRTFRGSQDDESFLAGVLEQTGPLDIVIDDGSHQCNHVIKTFEFLFPRMNEPGFYVVEDTQTSYWEDYGGSNQDLNRPDTTMGYFKGLVDGLNYTERGGHEPSYSDRHISEMHFYHNMIFIKKQEH
jgi:hypothetical protein